MAFRRDQYFGGLKLTGARWWQEQQQVAPVPQTGRRGLMLAAAAVGGLMLVGGCFVCVRTASKPSTPTADYEAKESEALEAQRKYGWNFGATDAPLEFDSGASESLDPSVVRMTAEALKPTQARLVPFYVPTLFQSAGAAPTDGSYASTGVDAQLKRYDPPSVRAAYERGRALGSLCQQARKDVAVMVDLPGPEAVAFAAGLSEALEPVFLFDNWPHPRAVVPSHQTLATAATYLDKFRAGAKARAHDAPPVFVLDRNRLAPYTDDPDKFDNRYMAKTPPAAMLQSLGIKQLLYVAPTASDTESDDVNADFVQYANASIAVKMVAATDFRQNESPNDAGVDAKAFAASGRLRDGGAEAGVYSAYTSRPPSYFYGGSPGSHYSFWDSYGWGTPAFIYLAATNVSRGYGYRPAARTTPFGYSTRAKPSGFGVVSVVASRSSGRVVGFSSGRSGSFGRSGSWSSS